MNVRTKLCKWLADTYQADVHNYFLCARHHAWCWGREVARKEYPQPQEAELFLLMSIITIVHCAWWLFQR